MPRIVCIDQPDALGHIVQWFANRDWDIIGLPTAREISIWLDKSTDIVLFRFDMAGVAEAVEREVKKRPELAGMVRVGNTGPWDSSRNLGEALLEVEGEIVWSLAERDFRSSQSEQRMRVFISYASADIVAARKLYGELTRIGCQVWLDEKQIRRGQDWELEIRKAIRSADVVLVCLTKHACGKRGFFQKEISLALDVADEQPEGATYIVPVKLSQCDIPDRLRRWHCVDLTQAAGWPQLLRSLAAVNRSTA